MDQIKIGSFLKELRKEKGLTQSQLAERFHVSDRTVSRWETGSNMPDLSLLVELADFYNVDIREIICGERKSECMEKEEKETLQMVADYAENEKQVLFKRIRVLNILGTAAMVLAFIINAVGWYDVSLFWENMTQCLYSFSFGVFLANLLYSAGVLLKVKKNPTGRRVMKVVFVICVCITAAGLILSLLV